MTIHPNLVDLSSPKFDVVLGAPADTEVFSEWIDLAIGATDSGRIYGGESFSVNVCSVRWIAQQVIDAGARCGHGQLIVARWDITTIREHIEAICEWASAPDWPSVIARLSRYLMIDAVDFDPT
jgi:immunity protein 8 of polymorphic toxin system